jgi:hypothetical protein
MRNDVLCLGQIDHLHEYDCDGFGTTIDNSYPRNSVMMWQQITLTYPHGDPFPT